MVQLSITIDNLLSWSEATLTSLTGRSGQSISDAVEGDEKTDISTPLPRRPCHTPKLTSNWDARLGPMFIFSHAAAKSTTELVSVAVIAEYAHYIRISRELSNTYSQRGHPLIW